jgi:hypothetical protein
MSYKNPRRPVRSSVEGEEKQAWITIYQRARSSPTLAAEVMAQLNQNPEIKGERLGLYLCCKECVRSDRTRQARNQRIGAFVRRFATWLFVFPLDALRHMGRGSRDAMIEMLPEVERPTRPALAAPAVSSRATPPANANVPAVIRTRKRQPPKEPSPPEAGFDEKIPS